MIKNIFKYIILFIFVITIASCPQSPPPCNPSFRWKVAINDLSATFPSWWTDKTGVYLLVYNKLYHTTDGSTWSYSTLPGEIITGTGSAASGVFGWGDSPNDIYIGHGNKIFHFNGITWTTSLDLPSNQIIYAGIAGNNSSDVYAMAATVITPSTALWPTPTGLVLYHFTGFSWTPVTTIDEVGATSNISVFGSNVYFTMNYLRNGPFQSLLFHYNGITWETESFSNNIMFIPYYIAGVFGFNEKDLYTITSGSFGSAVLHFTGDSWKIYGGIDYNSRIQSGIFAIDGYHTPFYLWGTSDNDIYIGKYKNDDVVVSHFDGNQWHDTVITSSSSSDENKFIPYIVSIYGLSSSNVFLEVEWACLYRGSGPAHFSILKGP